jgi:hypothetical protein
MPARLAVYTHTLLFLVLVSVGCNRSGSSADYQTLVKLFEELRQARQPSVKDGVADYTPAAIAAQRSRLAELSQRLLAIDFAGWPLAERVDYLLVQAQLDGLDFELTVLKPWSRDPGHYVDLVQNLPFTELPAKDAGELAGKLRSVPEILEQARGNLTEAGGELTALAIRNLEQADGVGHGHPYRETPPAGVIGWYQDLLGRLSEHHPDLVSHGQAALAAVEGYRDWLKQNQDKLTAASGVGLENFNWYLKHVRLMPFTAEDCLEMGRRELERATAALKLAQNQNRNLPPLAPSPSEAEYSRRKQEADAHIRRFIREREILTIPDYVGELATNVPWIVRPGGKRNFWEEVQYRDPRPDHVHAVIPGHRFDGLLKRHDPRPIRGKTSDSGRSEGWGFYLEEMFLKAGLLDELPRTRELFYIFMIARAVRNEAEVKLHANQYTIADAVKYMMDHTPYMDENVARVDAEIYLRRPTYGISYQMGKIQIDQLVAERAIELGEKFNLKEFHDRFLAAGTIPVSLIRWEMTGKADETEHLWRRAATARKPTD